MLERLERMWQSRPGVLGWVMTTDHKRIGLLYFWTTLVLFAAGGAEALIMRTQLIQPNQHVVGPGLWPVGVGQLQDIRRTEPVLDNSLHRLCLSPLRMWW